MKKVFVICLFGVLFLSLGSSYVLANQEVLQQQQETLHITDFIKEANYYSKEVFPDINMGEILQSGIKGEINHGFWKNALISILGKEILNALRTLGTILAILVIHSLLKSFSDGLENKGVSQVIYYVQYILIVTFIMANFTEIITVIKETINNLVGFMNCLVPILMTLMVTTGSIATANIIQPLILFVIQFIGNGVQVIILPVILVATVLGIVSNISNRIQIGKLSKFFHSGMIWVLGVALTIFVGILSLEGTLSSSVDGLTAKATKAAVSSFVPVVGKILGDAVDTVMGCANILKNAVGVVGVLVVLGICMAPIIRLSVLTIAYYFTTALAEVVADKKMVILLEQMSNSFKTLLAIIFAISTMLLVGITLVIKISNSGMMYR